MDKLNRREVIPEESMRLATSTGEVCLYRWIPGPLKALRESPINPETEK